MRKKRKLDGFTKLIIVLGSIFILFILGYLGFLGAKAYFTWDDVYQHRDREYDPLAELKDQTRSFFRPNGGSGTTVSNASATKPFTILLAGVDSSTLKTGRSDTLIVAIVDIAKNKVSLASIPRDTYVELAGEGKKDKINHSYAYDGIQGTIKTVEDFLDTPINYYVTVNFKAVEDFVDTIGGLDVNVEKNMNYTDASADLYINLKKGPQHLTGKQTLHYSRFRKDAEGDYGRMRRQQQVIREMINQSVDFRNVSKLNKILTVLGDNVKTDISLENMVTLMNNMNGIKGDNIETIPVSSTTGSINGISYVFIDDEHRDELINEIHSRLGINEEK